MYYEIIQQFHRTLGNLDAILSKSEKYAADRGFNPDNFLTARLAPDMLPLLVQVRIACDGAKAAAANLAGQVAPRHEDDEKTFADLHTRIGKVRAYLETFKPEDFAGTSPTALVSIPYPPGKFMRAGEYIVSRQIPNFFFHVTTTYALLRAGGVPLGKTDYLGDIALLDG